jgi:hypothetical protein
MDNISLILELVKQQGTVISTVQNNIAVLNEHSGIMVQQLAAVETEMKVVMWLLGTVGVAVIGLFVEKFGKIFGDNNKTTSKKDG